MDIKGVVQAYRTLVVSLKQVGLYDENDLPVVSAGASMVLFNIKPEADDLDVSVSKEVWDKINIPEVSGCPVKIKRISHAEIGGDIDIHISEDGEGSDVVCFMTSDGFKVASMNLNQLKDQRVKLGREKDKVALSMIEAHITAMNSKAYVRARNIMIGRGL